jgi:uncharacterized protein (DUF58 family)
VVSGRGFALFTSGLALVAVALVWGRSDAMLVGVGLLTALVGSWVAVHFAGPPVFFQRTMPSGPLARGQLVTVAFVPGAPGRVRLLTGHGAPGSAGVKQKGAGSGASQTVRAVPGAKPTGGVGGLATAAGERLQRPVDLRRIAESMLDVTPWNAAPVTVGRDGAAIGYSFEAPARGVFQLGPAIMTVPGPLGLVTASYVVSPPGEIVVAPALVPVDVPRPDLETDRQRLSSATTAERVTDPAAVREYQSGDPRRLVHWKATARRDRLMVRDTVTRGLPDAWVLADDAANPGEQAELALAVAASVAVRLLRLGHTVRLVRLSAQAPPAVCLPAAGSGPLLEWFARLPLGSALAGPTAPDSGGVGPGSPQLAAGVPPTGETPGGQNGWKPGAMSADSANWVGQMAADMGSRGMTGPVYGAVARLDGDVMDGIVDGAVIADPAVLWLVGEAAQTGAAAVAQAGWDVAEVAA